MLCVRCEDSTLGVPNRPDRHRLIAVWRHPRWASRTSRGPSPAPAVPRTGPPREDPPMPPKPSELPNAAPAAMRLASAFLPDNGAEKSRTLNQAGTIVGDLEERHIPPRSAL